MKADLCRHVTEMHYFMIFIFLVAKVGGAHYTQVRAIHGTLGISHQSDAKALQEQSINLGWIVRQFLMKFPEIL